MRFSVMLLVCREAAVRLLTPRWVLCILSLLICNQLALLTWQGVISPEVSPVRLPTSAVTQVKSDSGDEPERYRYTFFGTSVSSATARAPLANDNTLRNAPPSSLKLRLTGIVASASSERSIAIIAKDNKQFSLGVGDTVPGYDARIAAIFADRTVISYQGRYEALLLFADAPPTAAKENGEKSPSTAQLKAQLQKQPQSILNYLSISPVMVDNKLTGYRLNPGKEGELFRKVGLHENDLAVALNGLDLRDAQQAQQALKQLPELSELTLTVEREGQLQDIYFALGDD
ncbi:type II secretion system protein C (GspC) [Serratia fonticola]|uniref:Type II secretion system protein C (GspC) n=1 Tax=Serratia fonticola TaxID=47917 RepID=A0A559TCX2_SERFO|nr:type II secretion system protein GspC [Serratia fonticola]TQI80017.1 type II secretion system protein C (GspC) [Serratia fonticola]TQI97957.1 type II secretion system protein C (GspC) [Serratia fonticola]TVZ72452.1 type II secretion system protein C (GspC) [Serratia fonticola]